MTSRRMRVAFHPSATQQIFASVAYAADWDLTGIFQRSEKRPFELVYRTEDGTSVHYIEDFLLELEYSLVQGIDPEPVVALLRQKLRTVSVEDALAMAEEAKRREERAHAMYYAVIAANEADPRVIELVLDALADDDPEMRRWAIFACGYAEWKELRPALERLAGQDPDPTIREAATAMVAGLDKVWHDSHS